MRPMVVASTPGSAGSCDHDTPRSGERYTPRRDDVVLSLLPAKITVGFAGCATTLAAAPLSGCDHVTPASAERYTPTLVAASTTVDDSAEPTRLTMMRPKPADPVLNRNTL